MTQPTPQVLQTFALLQIAAEALLGRRPADKQADPFDLEFSDLALLDGNLHSSRMPPHQALLFTQAWEVVAHQPNTATGFSATLFKCIGSNETSVGVAVGQYVVSFRSTEFIEDYARDNKATNDLEVKTAGWAFGQLADLKTWYETKVQPVVGANKVDVTGYSLGGHLATAFYELVPSAINRVFTFNGAGVGERKNGIDLDVTIDQFRLNSQFKANRRQFSNPEALSRYDELVERYGSGGSTRIDGRKTSIASSSRAAGVREGLLEWRHAA